MSKLGDFIKSGFGVFGGKIPLNVPLADDDLNEISFGQILNAMEKLDPLDKNARGDGEQYAENLMKKMRLTTKREDVLGQAQDQANFYAINLFDRKLRQNQIDQLKRIAQEAEKSFGNPSPTL